MTGQKLRMLKPHCLKVKMDDDISLKAIYLQFNYLYHTYSLVYSREPRFLFGFPHWSKAVEDSSPRITESTRPSEYEDGRF